MTKHTVTALFDDRENANNAALLLRHVGVRDRDIAVSPEAAASGYAEEMPSHVKGFWAALDALFGGTVDHASYAEGVRRGGILVTAHIDDAKVDEAVEILERHGSVDLGEREAAWRHEGWTGSRVTGGGVVDMGAGPLRSTQGVDQGNAVRDAAAVLTAPSPSAAYRAPADTHPERAKRDDVIPVIEEQATVGKRAVNRGRVRLHGFVVETPFVQEVHLRDETVTVDRRHVDRPVATTNLGADAFRTRMVEMDEIDEEAVVAKTVRVVEEIGIRKDVTDRVETITDTVRSTIVDIEDTRTARRGERLVDDAGSVGRALNMEVLGSDGQPVGVVDRVEGSTLVLRQDGATAGGTHHLIPAAWVESADGKVRLRVTADEAKRRWTVA